AVGCGLGGEALLRSSCEWRRVPPSAAACCAKTRAASTKIGSFSKSSACSGVLEVARLTAHSSRVGASKFNRLGCRYVRCQVVYIPRRYRSGPWLAEYSRLGKLRAARYPAGSTGLTLGPPTFSTSKPAACKIVSRTFSASTRNRFWRARRGFSGSLSGPACGSDDCWYV